MAGDIQDDNVLNTNLVLSLVLHTCNDFSHTHTTCQVRHYLMREEEELEQRVREFERREKEKFAQLQQKTLSQRAQLLA